MIGRTLAHYRITGAIGAGGMGEVYRATDTKLGRDVALKVLPAEMASSAERLERFEREARALAALDHPGIVTVHSVEESDGVHFLTMQLVEGQPLDRLIPEGGLPVERILDIATGLADALGAAHEKGIVHRDLKPANVMVTKEGRVKVLDFGLALMSRGTAEGAAGSELPTQAHTREGVVMGTLPYMSPEQAAGRHLDHRSDIYSLGVMLFEMATGGRPFGGGTTAELVSSILKDPAPDLARVKPGLPLPLSRTIARCLEKAPADRFASGVEVRGELEAFRRSVVDAKAGPLWHAIRKPRFVVPALAVAVVLALFAFKAARDAAQRQWARQEALPQVTQWIEDGKYGQAFDLAKEASRHIPDDPVLLQLWDRMSDTIAVETDPPEADVLYRDNAPQAKWRSLGKTPITGHRLPLGGFRLRIQKEGFEPREMLSALSYSRPDETFKPLPSFSTPAVRNRISFRLDPAGTIPSGMVAVDGGRYLVPLTSLPVDAVTLEPYFIDRTEVTNARFKEFVDAGGYAKREYWQHEFRREDRTLTWEEGMKRLVDATGRPGPATWEVGNYPAGKDDFPVGGLSWYEAAAYAAFRGKSLPTVYHWIRAALPSSEHVMSLTPQIVPLSNFGSDGLAAVGSFPAIGASGAVDLAGNAREWCWNARGDRRLSLGGSWDEPVYMFTAALPMDPFDRSHHNGFRCMKERNGETAEKLKAPVDLPAHDFRAREAFSDDVFEEYKRVFSYADTPLNPVLESTDETMGDWRRENVSIDSAYGERFTVHLDLPTKASPPYQAVVYFPGSNALEQSTFEDAYWERFDYIPRSGRVLVRPVLAEMYERSVAVPPGRVMTPQASRERATKWVQDLGRTIDYLESRGDIDRTGVAYMGLSLGSVAAPIMLVAEPRFQSAVLITGGMSLNFTARRMTPRVGVPVLLLGGRYDYVFPLETSQTRFMELIATPDKHKRHVIFEAGHLPLPRAEVIRETLAWLDRYQGPVTR